MLTTGETITEVVDAGAVAVEDQHPIPHLCQMMGETTLLQCQDPTIIMEAAAVEVAEDAEVVAAADAEEETW